MAVVCAKRELDTGQGADIYRRVLDGPVVIVPGVCRRGCDARRCVCPRERGLTS